MRRAARAPGTALPVLLAAVVVLGILGMHALTTHGAGAHTDHAAMTMAPAGAEAAVPDDHPAGHPAGDPAHRPAPTVTTTAADGGEGHDLGTVVMLCAAMLAAAAGVVLLLPRRRAVPRTWQRPIGVGAVPGWLTARLGTGPPPVWEFSVIRC